MPLNYSDPEVQRNLKEQIERGFPKLKGSSAYEITSLPTDIYNCIAWAADDVNHVWWPDRNWPRKLKVAFTLEAFVLAFEKSGYVRNPDDDPALVKGFEKIAIFCCDSLPRHAARQMPSGLWTSKMGKAQDITHHLSDLEGSTYGNVAAIMQRPLKPSAKAKNKSPKSKKPTT